MVVNFLHQPWNSVSIQPEGHCMPLGNADWKIRGCRNLSVYLHFFFFNTLGIMPLLSRVSEKKLHQVNVTLGEISNGERRLGLSLPEKSEPEHMGFGPILAF